MIDLGPGMILWNFQRQLRSQIAMDDFVPMGHLHRFEFYSNRRIQASEPKLSLTETIAYWGSRTNTIVH